jgi:hypothetical protein
VDRYNQLYVPNGTISQIELDLMLDEIKKLYETFKTIGNINQTRLQNQKKPDLVIQKNEVTRSQQSELSDSGVEKPLQKDADSKAALPSGLESKASISHDEKEILSSEPLPDVIVTIEEEPESVISNQIQEAENTVPAASSFPEQPESEKPAEETISNQNPAMLADKYNQKAKSLSDTISAKSANEPVGSRIAFNPISDLSTGIGLNDKFSIISDLFGNNAAVYDEAIARINKAVNLDEANWILKKYHSQDWSQKHESYSRLKDFIKRRFI